MKVYELISKLSEAPAGADVIILTERGVGSYCEIVTVETEDSIVNIIVNDEVDLDE